MRRSRVVAVLVVVALAVGVWWLAPTDARRIRARLKAIAEAANAPDRETDFDRLARTARFAGAFTIDAVVEFGGEVPAIEGRDTLTALVVRAASPSARVTVTVVETTVAVGQDGRTADATVLGQVTIVEPPPAQPTAERRQAAVVLVKNEGKWLVSRAAIGPPLPAEPRRP